MLSKADVILYDVINLSAQIFTLSVGVICPKAMVLNMKFEDLSRVMKYCKESTNPYAH